MIPSQYGAVGSCCVEKKAGRQSVLVGSNEVSEIVNLIRELPDCWGHASVEKGYLEIPGLFDEEGNAVEYGHKLRIFQGTSALGFTIYFDTDLTHVALFTDVKQVKGAAHVVSGVEFAWKPGAKKHLEIRLPKHDENYWPPTHPIHALCHRAFTNQQCHVIRPGLAGLFPKVTVDQWFRIQAIRAASDHLKSSLEKLCEGWVKFYKLSATPNYGLPRLEALDGEGEQIFGLTWIFPWAVSIIREFRPSCLELDGTFESMQPFTLEIIEAIIANEAIPIGLGISPTETITSYKRLHDHLAEAIGPDGEDLLKGIPILCDQGPALKGFKTLKGLVWLLCHRHLINGAGASSIGGDWFRRLLKAGNLEEAREIEKIIRIEMEALKGRKKILFRRSSYKPVLKAMLDAVRDDLHVNLDWWARWKREFCPTTSNAAESIHAQLNKRLHEARSFFSRLSIVKKYLWERFTQRDSLDRVEDRAANRWLKPDKFAKMSPGNRLYYFGLHTFAGDDGLRVPTGVYWRFQKEPTIPVDFPPPAWDFSDEPPPSTWLKDDPPAKAGAASGGKKPTEKNVVARPDAATDEYFARGREILRSALILGGCRKQKRQDFEDVVWAHGVDRGLRTKEAIGPDDEAGWRLAVYNQLGLLNPKRPRQTAPQ
jgi:hypothetical protein